MTAAKVLLQAGTSSLPIDLNALADSYGIKLVSYKNCMEIYDISDIYALSPYGFSFRENDRYICSINENVCGNTRRRFTEAHEIAHVLLGHINEYGDIPQPQCERDADKLAGELLAPLSVLHFCGVSSSAEITRLCGISMQAAEMRFRELCRLRRQHSELMRSGTGNAAQIFLPDEDSRKLHTQMLDFIAEYLTRRAAHDGYAEHLKRISGKRMTIE